MQARRHHHRIHIRHHDPRLKKVFLPFPAFRFRFLSYGLSWIPFDHRQADTACPRLVGGVCSVDVASVTSCRRCTPASRKAARSSSRYSRSAEHRCALLLLLLPHLLRLLPLPNPLPKSEGRAQVSPPQLFGGPLLRFPYRRHPAADLAVTRHWFLVAACPLVPLHTGTLYPPRDILGAEQPNGSHLLLNRFDREGACYPSAGA